MAPTLESPPIRIYCVRLGPGRDDPRAGPDTMCEGQRPDFVDDVQARGGEIRGQDPGQRSARCRSSPGSATWCLIRGDWRGRICPSNQPDDGVRAADVPGLGVRGAGAPTGGLGPGEDETSRGSDGGDDGIPKEHPSEPSSGDLARKGSSLESSVGSKGGSHEDSSMSGRCWRRLASPAVRRRRRAAARRMACGRERPGRVRQGGRPYRGLRHRRGASVRHRRDADRGPLD